MMRLLALLAAARIISGETPGCPVEAKIAVANVMLRQPRHRQVCVSRLAVAWPSEHDALPQLAGDALYAIGPGDKARMPWLKDAEALRSFQCAGTRIEVYEIMKITP